MKNGSSICHLLLMALAFVSIAFAQEATKKKSIDPTGVWTWEQSGFGGNRSSVRELTLEVKDGKLSGSFRMVSGNNAPQGLGDATKISDTKINGDEITFAVTRSFNGNEFKSRYTCVVSGDEMAGIVESNFGGQTRETPFIAKRKAASTVAVKIPATTSEPGNQPAVSPPAANPTVPEKPSTGTASDAQFLPTRIPEPGPQTDKPYRPEPILPGGIVIPLYAADSPDLKQDRVREPEKYNMSQSVHGRIQSIVNIHNPSVEIHRADGSGNTGTCVILAAGGGHRTLNVGTEAADFVPFFYNYGVHTAILRNRLRSDGYVAEVDAVNDALQAIRLVRAHAGKWGINPNRIGIIGFSAGAELSGPAAIQFVEFDKKHASDTGPLAGISSRPDFVGLLYPGPTPFTRNPKTEVPKNAPPSFVATPGSGDQVHAIWAMDYFNAMLRAGIPNIEMHVYGNGVHAGGLKDRRGTPLGKWQDRYIDWFRDLGFLSEPSTETKAATDTAAFVARPQRSRGKAP